MFCRLRFYSVVPSLRQAIRFCSASAATAAPRREPPQVSAISAQGTTVDLQPVLHFKELESSLPPWLIQGLHHMSFTTPTGIQAHTIPLLLQRRDMIGIAPTGSGKTVAFAVPSLALLDPNQHRHPQVIVLCPVRELCQQTAKVFRDLASGGRYPLRVCEAYGGAPRPQQARALHNGCSILIATPGRLADFLQCGDVSFESLRFIVFDEADRLLDMGFTEKLSEILSYVPREGHIQKMMWSATWPESIQALARRHLSHQHILLRVSLNGVAVGDDGLSINEDIEQHVICCNNDDERMSKLADLYMSGRVKPSDKALMFVLRKNQCESVAREVAEGLSATCGVDTRRVAALHGDMPQHHRDRVMSHFKEGRIKLLVATDVAARGLDIPNVEYVFNYDAPHKMDSYCHRIGRTGRNGQKGTAFTFILPDTAKLAPELIDYLRQSSQTVTEELMNVGARARAAGQERSQRKWGNFRQRRNSQRGNFSSGGFGGGGGGEWNNWSGGSTGW